MHYLRKSTKDHSLHITQDKRKQHSRHHALQHSIYRITHGTDSRGTTASSKHTPSHSIAVARTPMLLCPLQHVSVPSSCSTRADLRIPRTPVSSGPLQNLQMASFRGSTTGQAVPITPVCPCPHQNLKVPTLRRAAAREAIPFTAVFPAPL